MRVCSRAPRLLSPPGRRSAGPTPSVLATSAHASRLTSTCSRFESWPASAPSSRPSNASQITSASTRSPRNSSRSLSATCLPTLACVSARSMRARSLKTWPRRCSSSPTAAARLSMPSVQQLEEPARAGVGEPGPGLEEGGLGGVALLGAGVPREQDDLRLADQVLLRHEANAGEIVDLAVESAVPAAAAQLRV